MSRMIYLACMYAKHEAMAASGFLSLAYLSIKTGNMVINLCPKATKSNTNLRMKALGCVVTGCCVLDFLARRSDFLETSLVA